MPFTDLLRRIDERLEALKLSDRKASMMAVKSPDLVRDMRRFGKAPKADKLVALANVLEVPPAYLLQAIEGASARAVMAPALELQSIFVKGEVQAGVWREALEWHPSDWVSISAPVDNRFQGVERFGLLVRGSSMNRLYPDGTVVIVVQFHAIGRMPQKGERVVVLRRNPTTFEFEATLKEYDRDARGRHVLWPRSDDPDHQVPFVIGPDLAAGSEGDVLPSILVGGRLEGPGDEVRVHSLVVGSYRPEVPLLLDAV